MIGAEKPSLDDLVHFGVLGMKWGVHKRRADGSRDDGIPENSLQRTSPNELTRTTSTGEKMTLSKKPTPAMAAFLGRHIPSHGKRMGDSVFLTIHDNQGKKVGDAQVYKKDKDELNLVWLGIDKSARGQGYATQAMKSAAEFGKKQGFKKLTLEVPGNSPDARHIYEKLGFKVLREPSTFEKNTDSVWGGLTTMEYNISKKGSKR